MIEIIIGVAALLIVALTIRVDYLVKENAILHAKTLDNNIIFKNGLEESRQSVIEAHNIMEMMKAAFMAFEKELENVKKDQVALGECVESIIDQALPEDMNAKRSVLN